MFLSPCVSLDKAPHFSRLGDEEVNAGQNATFSCVAAGRASEAEKFLLEVSALVVELVAEEPVCLTKMYMSYWCFCILHLPVVVSQVHTSQQSAHS